MGEPRDIPKVYGQFLLFFLVINFVIYLYALVYIERVISYYNYNAHMGIINYEGFLL